PATRAGRAAKRGGEPQVQRGERNGQHERPREARKKRLEDQVHEVRRTHEEEEEGGSPNAAGFHRCGEPRRVGPPVQVRRPGGALSSRPVSGGSAVARNAPTVPWHLACCE